MLFLLNNTNNFQPFEKSSILHIPTAISEDILPLAYTNAHSRYSADIQSKKHCKPVTCQALFWCGNLSLSKTDDISASWRFGLSGDETNHTANKKMLNHSLSDAIKSIKSMWRGYLRGHCHLYKMIRKGLFKDVTFEREA